MKIFILGATGMLGKTLTAQANIRNFEVIGAARSGTDISLDIIDCQALESAVNSVQPQVIINAAALTDPALCEKDPSQAYLVNARSVGLLSEISRKIGAYLVQISTDHYFTGDNSARHTESNPVHLVNEYARTKYAGEKFALTYHQSLVVRTNIVGFRHKGASTFIEWIINSLENASPMILFSDYFTSSLHVSQFSSALFDLLEKKAYGILNLASRDVFSKRTFIEAIAVRLGYLLANARVGSVLEVSGPLRAESLGLDVAKVEEILGYKMPTMDEVIECVVAEYREG